MAGIIENGQVIVKFVTPMSVVSNQPAFVSDSISLKRVVSSQAAQRWEISTRVEPSNSSADMLIHTTLNGFDKVFEIQMPQVYRSSANSTTSTSVISVGASTSAGTSSILVTNNNGIIAKGEFINFSNHDKVYLVTTTLNGNGTLEIFPKLLEDIDITTTVKYGKDTSMKSRYDINNTLGIIYEDGIMSDPGTLIFIEAL